MRIREAAEAFLAHCLEERGLSLNSIAAYRQDLDEFGCFIGAKALDGIGGDDFVAYASHLTEVRQLAPATVRRRIACLKTMFKWLTRRSKIGANPFAMVDLRIRIPARLPRALARADMRRLMRAAETAPRLTRLALLCLFATGARVGELASITLGDLDLHEGVIRILGKGSRERQVFVTDADLLSQLRRFVREERAHALITDRLFVTPQGLPVATALIRCRITSLARRAGVSKRVTPHVLRHTAATALLEAGVDMRYVQRLLGHQSIATTQIYVHVADEALKSAIRKADTLSRVKLAA